jgi:hypothetical protein
MTPALVKLTMLIFAERKSLLISFSAMNVMAYFKTETSTLPLEPQVKPQATIYFMQ